MIKKTLSLVAALAFATTAAHADQTNNEKYPISTAPLYLISSSNYNKQSSPIGDSVQDLPYSSIQGMLAHVTGTTKNEQAIGIQQWGSNPILWRPESKTVAVAEIHVLGMPPLFDNEILAGSPPTYKVNDAPTSATVLKTSIFELATRLAGSQVKQQATEKESLDLAVDSEIKTILPKSASFADIQKSFHNRFPETASTFSATDAVDAAFIVEVEYVAKLFDTIAADFRVTSTHTKFVGLVMTGVQNIATHHGQSSKKHETASAVVRNLMEKIIVPQWIKAFGNGAKAVILFSAPASQNVNRALAALPILYGLGNFEQCAAQDSAGCTSITNSCNGRGACVQKKTDCWVCKCTTAPDSAFNRSTSPAQWSGNACQFKDTVAEFWLLWGTGFALMAVSLGVAMFLVSMGGSMDSGPMVAMSGGAPGIKVD